MTSSRIEPFPTAKGRGRLALALATRTGPRQVNKYTSLTVTPNDFPGPWAMRSALSSYHQK
jgi:hypothetical protein